MAQSTGNGTPLPSRETKMAQEPLSDGDTSNATILWWRDVSEGRAIIRVESDAGEVPEFVPGQFCTLALPQLDGVPVRIVDADEEAMLVRSGETVTVKGNPGDLVSLLPLGGDVHGVTAAGLAWPLEGDTFKFGYSRGVSNELTDLKARIEVEDGFLLVVHRLTPEHQEDLAE